MRYLSVCSGIEAATVAWHPLGWTPAAFSEIEAFPRAVLAHHYPQVPLHGDFTTIEGDEYGPIDLLVGGTPCQDFSVAGLRAGIAGDRGNLTLEFLRLASRTEPRWIVWENVPGVLSSDGGRALGAFLGGLAELGYGFAYRILDAQYAGLAQRRERVFVVGHLGDWRRAAAVLFEPESLRWDPPPRREAGERAASSLTASSGGISEKDGIDGRVVAGTLVSGSHYRPPGTDVDGAAADYLVAGTLQASGKAAGSAMQQDAESGLLVVAFGGNNTSGPIDVATAVNAHGGPMGRLDFESETFIAHAFDARQSGVIQYGDKTGPLDTNGWTTAAAFSSRFKGDDGRGYERPPQSYVEHVGALDTVTRHSVATDTVVRRLTPRECERLQGFPDGYTDITYRGKPAADGPKYKALGNSFAVPVVRWIGERIDMVERITTEQRP